MLHIIVDTETTGLMDFKLPADHPDQPRMCSLAAILCDDERVISSIHYLIKPDATFPAAMPDEAFRVHGYTVEYLRRFGVDPAIPLAFVASAIELGAVWVGHNANFDQKFFRGERRRLGLDDLYIRTKTICTLQMARQLSEPGRRDLSTLAKTLLGTEHARAHGAMSDAVMCRRIFAALRQRGIDATPVSNAQKQREKGEANRAKAKSADTEQETWL